MSRLLANRTVIPPLALGAALTLLPAAYAEEVGEAFGQPVRREELAHHLKTATLFSRSGQRERTAEETRREAWQNLVLLKEADRLGITVDRAELEQELRRLVSEQGVEYPGPLYETWVKVSLREDVQTFERRVEDLLRINKLLAQKTDPAVSVTEEEIRQKFLNQYNNFESEYIRFESAEEAQAFLERVRRDPGIWKETFDRKKEELGQRGAAWINIMSLEALIDLWKIPREDAYRILRAELGEFVPAENIYGPCVFRLLNKQEADLKELDEQKRQQYRSMLIAFEKRQAGQAFLDDLVQRAGYLDYEQQRRQAEEAKGLAAKMEELKEKSRVRLETTQGVLELKLFPEIAPKACENFIGLIEKGYYDGLTFHRVIKGFMIQGGDPTGTGAGGQSIWGGPFEDEVKEGITFDRPRLLAMANAGPNTNTSQFFITTVPTPWLNGKHTIFGEVVSGLEVVRKMESVPTDERDRPVEDQKILQADVLPPETP